MNAIVQESPPRWVGANKTCPPPLLRILIVIDGRVQLNKEPDLFGLGYALDALPQMKSLARVVVGIVTREPSIADLARGGREVLHVGFKFAKKGSGSFSTSGIRVPYLVSP